MIEGLKGIWGEMAEPVLALALVLKMNAFPLGGTAYHFIDVGGNDSEGAAVLTGPFDRVYEPLTAGNNSYRELENNLVYFELSDKMLRAQARLNGGGEITFKNVHAPTLQRVTVEGQRVNVAVNVSEVGKKFTSGVLAPGIYHITAEKGNLIVSSSTALFALTPDSLFLISVSSAASGGGGGGGEQSAEGSVSGKQGYNRAERWSS